MYYFAFSIGLLLFFFNDTATTEIYTLSLHDALPISRAWRAAFRGRPVMASACARFVIAAAASRARPSSSAIRAASALASRSEEHTSELQSRLHLVCRLLLEKKNIMRTLLTRLPLDLH